ncbi:cysteine ABC transporter substrate-binding protein [Helicobacter cetorum]|uniref:Glutamine ABC transporter periplasmic glutamine-binding protein n=1 Tax=Helicobacter cetorum (strain ATCC BAA-540 / CCUG 52418 / MIT 99-5656) TaxID=1163745 RepID=I0EUR5_HELCM|nr:cysteine ABC transporter substrate-binding protein [Helicobacter cetorum]AFI06684.1 glutamine ABC transporter periplasmic glutamine-binding protein [Helicobacter cetorum MIT 99-5656]
MKTNRLFKVWGAFLVLMALFFSACSDSQKEKQDALEVIQQRGVLKVGVFSDKPPFGFVDAKGEYQGFDIAIAKRIALDLLGDENKIEFVPVEASARVEFLKANKVDIIMANFTHTKEREEVIDFAKPYMKVALGVVSKDGVIKDVEDLKDKTLIVNKGTTADFYFTKNYPNIKLLKFEQNTETFLALLKDKAIALAHDNTLLFAWAKQHPEFKVGITSLGDNDVIAPAIKKGNPKLLEWLNNEIDALISSDFLEEAYKETLEPVYGDEVKPKEIIFD